MLLHSPIDLKRYYNAVGATCDTSRVSGAVNAWGNSFPAEELPFGSTLTVLNIPFHLPDKDGSNDHIEAMGQVIELPEPSPVTGLALLCFGEMGDQELDLDLCGANSTNRHLTVVGEAWLVESDKSDTENCYACSHLHYPGDYELALLRPALWCWTARWQRPFRMTRIALGINPLFHLFAATGLHDS
jgi:hypothetical protein